MGYILLLSINGSQNKPTLMLSYGYFKGLNKYAGRLYFDIIQGYLFLGRQKTNASMHTHVGFRTHMRLFVSLFVCIGFIHCIYF